VLKQPANWPRPHYERPGGRPLLFYVVHGRFDNISKIDSRVYRTLGVHRGLELQRYARDEFSEYLAGFEEGYPWEELVADDPELAQRVVESRECLILRGELEDRDDLNYLRDSVGLLTHLIDSGGVCVYDPQMFRWWQPTDWKRQVFKPGGPVPRQHVVILTSVEGESGSRSENLAWYHTRGLRKFGRPDLSVHDVAPRYHEAIIDLIERFIEFQAFGGTIAEGQEIRMKSLPSGMTCHHRGDLDDLDFNNVHVEITPPR
jgi:hypothetical protein